MRTQMVGRRECSVHEHIKTKPEISRNIDDDKESLRNLFVFCSIYIVTYNVDTRLDPYRSPIPRPDGSKAPFRTGSFLAFSLFILLKRPGAEKNIPTKKKPRQKAGYDQMSQSDKQLLISNMIAVAGSGRKTLP